MCDRRDFTSSINIKYRLTGASVCHFRTDEVRGIFLLQYRQKTLAPGLSLSCTTTSGLGAGQVTWPGKDMCISENKCCDCGSSI